MGLLAGVIVVVLALSAVVGGISWWMDQGPTKWPRRK